MKLTHTQDKRRPFEDGNDANTSVTKSDPEWEHGKVSQSATYKHLNLLQVVGKASAQSLWSVGIQKT